MTSSAGGLLAWVTLLEGGLVLYWCRVRHEAGTVLNRKLFRSAVPVLYSAVPVLYSAVLYIYNKLRADTLD